MEPHTYIIEDISGDYAYLRQTDAAHTELFPVALALLPPESDIGTMLTGMMGCFEIV